jgi:phosphorylcholine metabolism protein LicD
MEDTSFFYDENNNVIAQSSSNFSRAKFLVSKEYYSKIEKKIEKEIKLTKQEIKKREREYEERQREHRKEKRSEVIWWQLPSEYL